MGERHDGCPFSEVAATIAANKAAGAFAPLLTQQLGEHSAHVLKRMLQLSKDLALYQAERNIHGVACICNVHQVPRPTVLLTFASSGTHARQLLLLIHALLLMHLNTLETCLPDTPTSTHYHHRW